jgi:type III secretory pathway component EscU
MESINSATGALQAASSTHVDAAKKDATTTMDRIAKETAAMYVVELGKEVARVTEQKLTKPLRSAVEEIHTAAYEVRKSSWVTVIAVIFAAILASALTVGGLWLLGKAEAVNISNAFPVPIESKTGRR